MPTTMPKVLETAGSKTVPSFQWRQASSPPPTRVSPDRTEPTINQGRQDRGGASWAQPNHIMPKKPKMAAVTAASRTCSRQHGTPPGPVGPPYGRSPAPMTPSSRTTQSLVDSRGWRVTFATALDPAGRSAGIDA